MSVGVEQAIIFYFFLIKIALNSGILNGSQFGKAKFCVQNE